MKGVMRYFALLLIFSSEMLLGKEDSFHCLRSFSYSFESRSTQMSGKFATGQAFDLSGRLIFRRLIGNRDSVSFGLQWYEPKLKLNEKEHSADIYSVPFAVTFNRNDMSARQFTFPKAMDQGDRIKLKSLFYTLHVQPPGGFFERVLKRYQIRSFDQTGNFLVRYFPKNTREMIRDKINYLDFFHQNQVRPFGPIAEIKIHHDRLLFQQDSCWLLSFDYQSAMTLETSMKIRIHSNSFIRGKLLTNSIPEDALLAQLPGDPKKWPDLSKLLSSTSISEASTKETFLKSIESLAGKEFHLDELINAIRMNRDYLHLLAENLHKYPDSFVSELMLALGKTDVFESHKILVQLALKQEISRKNRFRALMGLRYSKRLLSQTLIDDLIRYGRDEKGHDRDFADSVLLVLGVVAGQMKSEGISEYVMTELKKLQGSQVIPKPVNLWMLSIGSYHKI